MKKARAAEQGVPVGDEHLHERIASALRTDIAFGRYEVGAMLPTEAALRERFGVSRHTVREALRTLNELGLVERRQGSGTRVVARTGPVGYVHRLDTLSQLFQFTRDTQLVVSDLAIVEVPATEAEAIRAQAGSSWLRVRGVRRTADGGEDVSASTLYVHTRFTQVLSDITERTTPLHAIIEERTGEHVLETRQEITGGPMPADAAAVLGQKPGSPGIRVVRRYLDGSGSPMLTAINWHVAERFAYSITLRRDDAS